MKSLILFIAIVLIGCSSMNNTNDLSGNYDMVNAILQNPNILKSYVIPDSVKMVDTYLNDIWKSTNSEMGFKYLTDNLKPTFQILSDQLIQSNFNNALYHFVFVSDKDNKNESFVVFCFYNINNCWYLFKYFLENRYRQHFITLNYEESRINKQYCDSSYTILNKMINDTNYLTMMFKKSEPFGKRFDVNLLSGNASELKHYKQYINNIPDKNYTITAEKCFSTVDNKLINHRICLEFPNGKKLFVSLEYIENEWYLDAMYMYCNMRPYANRPTVY